VVPLFWITAAVLAADTCMFSVNFLPTWHGYRKGIVISANWLQASSTKTQRIREADVGQVIILDQVDGSHGVSLDTLTGKITVDREAEYLVITGPQIGREKPGLTANFRSWLRVNGMDVPNTNTLRSLTSAGDKDVLVCNALVHLRIGDELEILMATNHPDRGVGIEAFRPGPDEPRIPSIILTMDSR
jgi:hypothetical protein